VSEVDAQKRVRAMREAGLTLQQIAELVGVSWRTILRWEQGETRPENALSRSALEQASEKYVR